MTELENYIHTFFGVQQNDVSQIVTFFKPVQLKKGDFFVSGIMWGKIRAMINDRGQNIDLAKMGDPEYYQKIATWVDTEVLQHYLFE